MLGLGESVRSVLQAAVDGSVKALIVTESDPLGGFPDRALVEAALARVEFLVVIDYLDSATSRRARVLLPSETVYESGGVFINHEGRAQESPRIFGGGASIQETGAGSHPPRLFGQGVPGSDPMPAGWILAGISGEPDPAVTNRSERLRRDLARAAPAYRALGELPTIPEDGVRLRLGTAGRERYRPAAARLEPAPDGLEVVAAERTFGTEELSSYSACLQTLAEGHFIGLHPRDAADRQLREGDRVTLAAVPGSGPLQVRIYEDMAPGVALIPRLRGAALPAPGTRLAARDLRKG
jgi:NADH-quinone oxidoreductase subunit G